MAETIKQTFRGRVVGNIKSPFVGRVATSNNNHLTIKGTYPTESTYQDVTLVITSNEALNNFDGLTDVKHIDHIRVGDILVINQSRVRSLFRPYSNHNSIFATVRCNSNCLMCSQPPLDFDDTKENYLIWKYVISIMPDDVRNIGITGGEPMLMGQYLIDLVNDLTDKYPEIHIDILTNGRSQALAQTKNLLEGVKSPQNVIFAVPLYSDYYQDHDHIVQARDAFHQTCLGIHNLASLNFKVEIRVVLHHLSIPRLEKLAQFIHLNFPFVYHIAFMGLEVIGYTKSNLDELLVNNQEYLNDKLKRAISTIKYWNYNISIYNLPYCWLGEELWSYARQSISDWKNSYHSECNKCRLKNNCAGFFNWNLKYAEVHPVQ